MILKNLVRIFTWLLVLMLSFSSLFAYIGENEGGSSYDGSFAYAQVDGRTSSQVLGITERFDLYDSNVGGESLTIGSVPHIELFETQDLIYSENTLGNRNKAFVQTKLNNFYKIHRCETSSGSYCFALIHNLNGIELTKVKENRFFLDIDNSLIGYWNFEEADWNGRNTTLDLSPNQFDLIAGDDGKSPDGTGDDLIGQVVSFDGNDYFELSDNPLLNPSNELTISLWFKVTSSESGSWDKLVSKSKSSHSSPFQQYTITLGHNPFAISERRICFELTTEDLNKDVICTNSDIDDGDWKHLVATYDGSFMRLYLNGILHNEFAKSGNIVNLGQPLRVGGSQLRSGEYYKGDLDELMLFSRALTQEEIQFLYEPQDGDIFSSSLYENARSKSLYVMAPGGNVFKFEFDGYFAKGVDPRVRVIKDFEVDNTIFDISDKVDDNHLIEIEENVSVIPRSVLFNKTSSEIILVIDENDVKPVSLPPVTVDNTYLNITIDKDGDISYQNITSKDIALNSFNIKKFKDVDEAETFVENSFNVMTKIQTTVNITDVGGKNNVKISLKNIRASHRGNLTVYQIFSKSEMPSLADLEVASGNAEYFIVDKDPVIGWHFNESDGDDEIEYNTSGTGSGTILITQEPILFNEGELIVNYRETDCNTDLGEIELFQLDDIENSSVYLPNSSKLYKVCLSYIDETEVTFDLTSGDLAQVLFNYTNSSNMSFEETLTESLVVYANNNSEVFWDMRIQEANPTGSFSCLGSFDENGRFGDCGFEPQNRIWLHLGADYLHPVTELTYPYLSHSVKVNLKANDFGSGVQQIYYNVLETSQSGTSNGQDSVEFVVSCENKAGCLRTIEYYARDNKGNTEPVNVYSLEVIDAGTACQADCRAYPFPDRILRDCNGVNSCEFYNYDNTGTADGGVYVADLCHYKVEGSYVEFNSTHEIMCPKGPFRQTRFTQDKLDVSQATCNNLITKEFPVIFEGENVLMKLYLCLD